MREKKMRAKLEDFLQEVCEKTITNNQYPVLTSSKSGLFLQSDYFNKQVASKDNTGYKIIRRGQFTYRAMSDTGEFFPNMLECADVGIVSPAYPVFEIIKQDQIVPEYLNYYFKSNRFQNSISTFAQGSTRTSVKFGKLKKVSIELPEIKKQYQIIRTLDLLRTIINNRKKEVLELDELIRARFVEMFQDGSSPLKTVEEVCSNIVDCPHTTPKYEGELKNPAIRTSEIKKGFLVWNTMRYVSDDEYLERTVRLIPEAGDIVYGREGAFGNAAILPTGYKFCLGQRVMLLRPDYSKCTSEYLLHAVISDDVYQQAVVKNNASTVAHVNVKDVKQFKVPLPSLYKQKEFATFVHQIDKSKLLSGCRLFHSWAPENRDKPKHVGVPRRRTKDLREGRRQQ
ncbi:MAG: restriction endonuclease subunit S [Clostridia bacterium]